MNSLDFDYTGELFLETKATLHAVAAARVQALRVNAFETSEVGIGPFLLCNQTSRRLDALRDSFVRLFRCRLPVRFDFGFELLPSVSTVRPITSQTRTETYRRRETRSSRDTRADRPTKPLRTSTLNPDDL